MIKTHGFNKILKSYDGQFKHANFKKITSKKYIIPGSVSFQFILDKWGWTPDEGLGFVIRLRNLNLADGNDHIPFIDGELDITKGYLIKNNLLDINELKKINVGQSSKGAQDTESIGWFRAYDENHLKKVLDLLLPIIINEACRWSNAQNAPTVTHIPAKTMSASEWAKTQKELDELFGKES